jgi:hypothetical protein
MRLGVEMEGKGDFTPTVEPIIPAQDAADSKLPSLPAKGRLISPWKKVALTATLAATTAAGCVSWLGGLGRGSNGESPTPVPSGIIEPSNSPTSTPISSESPSAEVPSASPTANLTPGPEVTTPPEQLSQLDKNLKSWEAGTFLIPTSELSKNPDGTQQPINILVPPKGIASDVENKIDPLNQGIVLGAEAVNIGNHDDLIIYVGKKSKEINQKNPWYYESYNAGDLKNPAFKLIITSGLTDLLNSDGGTTNGYDASQVLNAIQKLTGHAWTYTLHGAPLSHQADSYPGWKDWADTVNSQVDFTDNAFYPFSADAGWTMNYKDSSYYPKVENLVNHRVTANSNEAEIPFLGAGFSH